MALFQFLVSKFGIPAVAFFAATIRKTGCDCIGCRVHFVLFRKS